MLHMVYPTCFWVVYMLPWFQDGRRLVLGPSKFENLLHLEKWSPLQAWFVDSTHIYRPIDDKITSTKHKRLIYFHNFCRGSPKHVHSVHTCAVPPQTEPTYYIWMIYKHSFYLNRCCIIPKFSNSPVYRSKQLQKIY